jgi:hypothetical protein
MASANAGQFRFSDRSDSGDRDGTVGGFQRSFSVSPAPGAMMDGTTIAVGPH